MKKLSKRKAQRNRDFADVSLDLMAVEGHLRKMKPKPKVLAALNAATTLRDFLEKKIRMKRK